MSARLLEVRGSWSVDAELVDGEVKLTLWHTTDREPARRFEPVQIIRLDYLHALELLGSLTIAMRDMAGLNREVAP